MKDNEDLLLKYSDTLVLIAFDRYKEAMNKKMTVRKDSSKNRASMDKILTEMVQEYKIPQVA